MCPSPQRPFSVPTNQLRITRFFNTLKGDYLLAARALVAEHLGVMLDFNLPMDELMHLTSTAANIQTRKQKEAEARAQQ